MNSGRPLSPESTSLASSSVSLCLLATLLTSTPSSLNMGGGQSLHLGMT
jgi:hypothetical protein